MLRCFYLFFILVFSMSSHADTDAVTTPEAAVDPVEANISNLNSEITHLSELRNTTQGQDNLALQHQIFKKNEELRRAIASAVDGGQADSAFLFQQIMKQQKNTLTAVTFLSDRTAKLSEELNAAKGSDKLSLLASYEEMINFLNTMYEAQVENTQWLKTLGKLNPKTAAKLKEEVSRHLEQITANIQLLRQKIRVDDLQLSVAPDSEKSVLQLNLLVSQRRLLIATKSLEAMTQQADTLGMPTADFKRLHFEVTGALTQDLLNTDVILAIVKSWSQKFWEWLAENALQHIFQIIVFFTIILTARLTANVVRGIIKRGVSSRKLKLSQLMQEFFISMSGKLVFILGILIALAQIGINLTPILTGFGIAGLIIGFALQDTLSNFAAGMMLLIYHPFDVGDFVLAGGVEGKVSHLSLVNTTIKTFDNQIIIVPNSKIWGDVIKNVTHERVRRVDMVFGVSYSDDVEKVENLLAEIVAEHPAILRSPAPMIKLHLLNSSSVDFIVRPWSKTEDYWDVYWDITREVKIRFDKEGISIPFPQQDVHIYTKNPIKMDKSKP